MMDVSTQTLVYDDGQDYYFFLEVLGSKYSNSLTSLSSLACLVAAGTLSD